MALEEAVQRDRMPSNPVALTQPPRPDRTRKKLGWTLDEARQFLRAAAEHRLFAAYHLGLVTKRRDHPGSTLTPSLGPTQGEVDGSS